MTQKCLDTWDENKPKKGHQNSRSLTSQQRLKLGPGAKMTGAGGNFRLNTRAVRPVTKTQKIPLNHIKIWMIKTLWCSTRMAPNLQQPYNIQTEASHQASHETWLKKKLTLDVGPWPIDNNCCKFRVKYKQIIYNYQQEFYLRKGPKGHFNILEWNKTVKRNKN